MIEVYTKTIDGGIYRVLRGVVEKATGTNWVHTEYEANQGSQISRSIGGYHRVLCDKHGNNEAKTIKDFKR